MQGVYARDDYGTNKALTSFDEEGAVAVGSFGFPVHISLFWRLLKFRSGDEKAHTACCKAPAHPAGEYRQRDGEGEAEGDGGEPPEKARIDEPHQAAPYYAQKRTPPVEAYGIFPACALIVAVLHIPAYLPAQQRGHHEKAVEYHAYRRKHSGDEYLAENAHDHAEKAAEIFRAALCRRKYDGEDFGQKEHDAGAGQQEQGPLRVPCRPYREQSRAAGEVRRGDKGFAYGLYGAEYEEEQPEQG